MKHRNILLSSLSLLVVLSFCLTQYTTFSQVKVNHPGPIYYNLNPEGGVSGAVNSSTPPAEKKFSAEKQTILNQLTDARKSGDLEKVNKLQDKLNEIDGVHPTLTPNDTRWHAIINPKSIGNSEDYMWYTIHGLGSWANAVCTEPVGATHAGRVWVAATQNGTTADSCKLYYSDNNGTSWSYYGQFYGAFNFHFRANELEIIPVWDGTTAWLFGVAGYNDVSANQSQSVFFRFNLTTGVYYAAELTIPGYSTSTNNYYNPRITTDNIAYPTSTFLFMVVAMDSTYSSSYHYLRQKGINCTNPTATTPTFDYTQPSSNGGWPWFWVGQPSGSYQYVDVGWYDGSTGDEMYVSVSFKYYSGSVENGNIHNAWSGDLGHTTTGTLTLIEANPTKGTRIAFNGGTSTSNQNGMLVYYRYYSGADWDVYYYNTTNGGITTGGWTNGYIDVSTLYATGWPDVIALRGGSNTFKATYSQGSSTAGSVRTYYSGFNGTSWSSSMVVSQIEPDTVFSCSRAGYLNGGGDDCLTIWRGSDAYTRASKLCNTTVGLGNNNEKPNEFYLAQNYPNPFNPSTDIKFSIPKAGLVKIVVYNTIGQEVTTLMNENKQPGNYKVSFNGQDLPSGVYFYKLSAVSGSESYSNTKKMLLIK